VFGAFRALRDAPDAAWSELAARLAGRGVPSLDDALADLRLGPVHAVAGALLEDDLEPAELERRRTAFLAAAGVQAPAAAPMPIPAGLDPAARAATLLAGVDRAAFDRLRLWVPLRAAGYDDWQILRTRIGLGLARAAEAKDPRRLVEAWLADPDARGCLGVNEWEGVEWLGKDAFDSLLQLAADLERAAGARRVSTAIARLRAAGEASGYRVDRLLDALGAPPPVRRARAPRPPRPRPS
jgi:hypothetical protein